MCDCQYPCVRDDCAAAVVMTFKIYRYLPRPLSLRTLGTAHNPFHPSSFRLSYHSDSTFLRKDFIVCPVSVRI